jgi:uncharacterized protein (UPF0335 family)
MSAEIVAADQLKAIVQRVERLEAEIADLNADKSEIYKEARANGFDVKVIKKVVSKRKIDEHEREEQDHVFDIYWDAVHGLNLVHAHARENIEQFDPTTGEFLNNEQPVTASEACRASQDAAPVTGRPAEPVNSLPTEGCGYANTEENAIQIGVTGGVSAATNREMDRATEGSFETGSEAAEKGREATATVAAPADLSHAGAGESPATAITIPSDERVSLPVDDRSDADANAGGNDVDRNALRVPTSVTGEGAASALPDSGEVVQEYVPPVPMKRLGYAHCFPELTKAQYGRLEFSISGLGIKNPIIRMGDVIIDGWARYNIARSLGIDYPVKSYDGKDVLLDVIEWQRASREFTPAQEVKIAADLAKEIPHRANDIMAAFGLAEALEAAE